jgi:hypothetical protein
MLLSFHKKDPYRSGTWGHELHGGAEACNHGAVRGDILDQVTP